MDSVKVTIGVWVPDPTGHRWGARDIQEPCRLPNMTERNAAVEESDGFLGDNHGKGGGVGRSDGRLGGIDERRLAAADASLDAVNHLAMSHLGLRIRIRLGQRDAFGVVHMLLQVGVATSETVVLGDIGSTHFVRLRLHTDLNGVGGVARAECSLLGLLGHTCIHTQVNDAKERLTLDVSTVMTEASFLKVVRELRAYSRPTE